MGNRSAWQSECCSNHCLAALDVGADVEQPFDCDIVQNRQVTQSMKRSMDWTLEDNMVDGLFFCATLTGGRGGHTHFYKQERKRPTAVRRWLSRTQALLGRVIPGGWMPVSEMKMRSLMSCPPTPHGWNCFLKNRKTFVACETYSQWSGVSEEIFGCPLNIKHSDFSVHFCFFWPNHLYKKVSKHEVATTCHMKLCTYDTPPTDPARDAPWSFIENLTNHVYSPSGPRLFEAIYL